MTRRFELVEGKSAKFWEVTREGSDLHLRWGRLGTNGQSQTKEFASDAAATKEADKLILSKTKKGYAEVAADPNAPPPAAKPAPARAPAAKAPAESPAAKPEAPEPAPVEPPPAPAAPTGPLLLPRVHLDRLGLADASRETLHSLRERLRTGLPARLNDYRALGPMIEAARGADRLSAEDHAVLVEEIEQSWSSRPLESQALAAIVLGREPRFATRILDAHTEYPQVVLALVASLQTADEVRRLIGGIDTAWLWPAPMPMQLLIERRGVDAVPLLVAMAEKLKEIRNVVDVMRTIEAVEIARVMGDLLDHRELKGAARTYLEEAPAFTIAALATSKKQMARSMVELSVRAHPELVEALLGQLDPNARAAVEQIRDAVTVSVPEAGPSELPRVLVEPPWTRTKKKASGAAVTLALTPLEMPEAVEWRDGQRAEWLAAQAYGQPTPKGGEQLRAAVDKWVGGDHGDVPSYQRGVSVYVFNYAEDDVALECWNRMTTDAFGYTDGDSVRRVVARLEGRGVPGYLAYTGKNATSAAEILSRVRTPRLAPFYARVLASRGKGRAYAQAWMETFPDEAAAGLIPEALGADKKARALAEDAIAYLGQKGHAERVLAIAARYGEATVEPITAALERDPLDAYPTKLPKLKPWADPEALPRPLLRGREKALPTSAVEHLLTMLAFSPLDPAYPGIEVVKEACDPQSLADFAWGLCSTWLGADGSSAGDFAMLALAHLAGDEGARRLTPLIRKWPGEAAHARAVKGLDVLAAIGSDVALMHLHGISQKLKFKGLQAKAQEKIAQVAEARELTTEELADRLVPDLDLDDDGSMLLDFGPRQFTVGFDEHLTPFVRQDGERKKALPKPGKSDDAEMAKAATAAFKALKKDARALAGHQLTRLEQLMCSERCVPVDVFQQFFVEHPLTIHIVRRLVWGAYADGELAYAFRIDDGRRPTDADDEPVSLADGMEIVLLHPLAMSEDVKARFGELFADYELLQPFDQLGRATYAATPEELAAKQLLRFGGKSAPLGAVRGLENQGWIRGMPQDAGIIWDVTKPIPGHPDLEIHVSLDPGFSAAGYNDFADTATQKLGAPALHKKGHWQASEGLEVLGAIQMSELIRDLTLIITD
ncbi:MAG: WGR and DUF4132 domain-containing protein [Sandaracinaceae bacterium]|nr:WGR and DUF4132 domain-containing protein [Sandaracinaceae bacterium]